MKSRKFGFLRHYRKIKIEGINLSHIINKCIKNGISLRDLRWKNPLESTAELQDDDFHRLKKIAGHSYKMTVLKEGGMIPLFRSMKANILTITGAFLLGALLFYQGLFVAEIRVDGYETLTEQSIRQTLEEAGLSEGVRWEEDYSHVKAALYEAHDEITWVSIFREGRLVKVNIAEANQAEAAKAAETTPVHIVAAKSAMIEKIMPLQGNAKVQKGDYVNKGDILISGKYKYRSTDYSRGDREYILYSHARGQAYAKVPRQVTFYVEKKRRTKEPTGRMIPGIYLKFGETEWDTTGGLCHYNAAVRTETKLIDTTRPMPLAISLIRVQEVTLREMPRSAEELSELTDAALRQYAREELKEGEKILSKSIDYSEHENVMEINVFLEVLEDIGQEKEIKVKKGKKEEQNVI